MLDTHKVLATTLANRNMQIAKNRIYKIIALPELVENLAPFEESSMKSKLYQDHM